MADHQLFIFILFLWLLLVVNDDLVEFIYFLYVVLGPQHLDDIVFFDFDSVVGLLEHHVDLFLQHFILHKYLVGSLYDADDRLNKQVSDLFIDGFGYYFVHFWSLQAETTSFI